MAQKQSNRRGFATRGIHAGQAPDLDERRAELAVELGVGFLDLGQHLEELSTLDDHVDGQKDSQDAGQRGLEDVQLVP